MHIHTYIYTYIYIIYIFIYVLYIAIYINGEVVLSEHGEMNRLVSFSFRAFYYATLLYMQNLSIIPGKFFVALDRWLELTFTQNDLCIIHRKISITTLYWQLGYIKELSFSQIMLNTKNTNRIKYGWISRADPMLTPKLVKSFCNYNPGQNIWDKL